MVYQTGHVHTFYYVYYCLTMLKWLALRAMHLLLIIIIIIATGIYLFLF